MAAKSRKRQQTAKKKRKIAKKARATAENARSAPTTWPARRPIYDLSELGERLQREEQEKHAEQERQLRAEERERGWGVITGSETYFWYRRRWYQNPRLWLTFVLLATLVVAIVLVTAGR